MQATASKKRFEFGRVGGSVAALGMVAAFAVGIATGIAGQAIIDDTTDSTDATPAVVQPKAYYSVGGGEGLVAGSNVTGPALKAYDVDGMGEGRLAGNAPLSVLPMAHTSFGQGEGILGGNGSRGDLASAVIAHGTAGMGEGWISQGRPQPMLTMRWSDGKSDGWIGN